LVTVFQSIVHIDWPLVFAIISVGMKLGSNNQHSSYISKKPKLLPLNTGQSSPADQSLFLSGIMAQQLPLMYASLPRRDPNLTPLMATIDLSLKELVSAVKI
jgi:hypothetical protein